MRLVYAFVFGKHFVRILLMIGFANVTLIILSYKQIAYWLFSSLMFLLGFAALFTWQVGGFVRRNRPQTYTFDRLPGALLP